MKRSGWILLVLSLFSLIPARAYAAREFKVYPARTEFENELEVALWNNYTASSKAPYSFNGTAADKTGLSESSLELEYGVTDRLTLEGYLDFDQPRGEPFQYVRARTVLVRYALFRENEKSWDTSFYLEYSLPKEIFDPSEEIEGRFIFEKSAGRWTVRLNPILTKGVSGPEVIKGLGFEYAAGVYFRAFHRVTPGLEFYGDLGELKKTDRHEHYLFPSFEYRTGTGWRWEAGAGFGLTDESDRFIIRNIISYEMLF